MEPKKPATPGGTVPLSRLAEILGGRFEGVPPGPDISGVAPLKEAVPGQITFFSDLKNISKRREELSASKASAVLAPDGIKEPLPLPSIRFPVVHLGLAKALAFFHPDIAPPKGIHPTAFVHEEASVHPSASIGPLAVVEAGARVGEKARIGGQSFIGAGSVIGNGAIIHPRVSILPGCRVGDRSIINSGAIIGSDGFGFVSGPQGHLKVPQVGIVEIGNEVEIGANVTIDRSTMGRTVVGDGTKIDNLVHIAHNCVIGKNCIIVAQVGLSGSTILEDGVTMAGQSGTAGHVTVGRGTTIAARGVVTQNVEPGSFVSGFPLKPHSEEKRIMASLRRLPEALKTLRELEAVIRPRSSDR